MSLKIGIIGLPNVGKSTLFNAITKLSVLAANYPFATIEPNVGTVLVPDLRFIKLKEIYNPEKIIPTTIEFTDIAGLVKGASSGEGLGNKFLSHIREVDAICHVVRCFDDKNVTHVEGKVNPINDIYVIDLELCLADLEIVDNRLSKIEKKAISSKDLEALEEVEVLKKIKEKLIEGKRAIFAKISEEEKKIIKSLNLITLKKVIYLCNINDTDITNPINEYTKQVYELAKNQDEVAICISAKIESEISLLDEEEKKMFLEDLEIDESGLDKVIRNCYKTLDLETYFTAGVKEVRAWTYKKGMNAKACAGIIHSDFEKGFIRAEVFNYEDLITYGNELKIKENGKLRVEGKDYIMQDGDICHFRFNV